MCSFGTQETHCEMHVEGQGAKGWNDAGQIEMSELTSPTSCTVSGVGQTKMSGLISSSSRSLLDVRESDISGLTSPSAPTSRHQMNSHTNRLMLGGGTFDPFGGVQIESSKISYHQKEFHPVIPTPPPPNWWRAKPTTRWNHQ